MGTIGRPIYRLAEDDPIDLPIHERSRFDVHEAKDGILRAIRRYAQGHETTVKRGRVAPWQSLKAAARFQAASASKKPVFLRLEAKGGHGVGEAKSRELVKKADVYAFLMDALTPDPKSNR